MDEFLQRVGQLFECVLFTASLAKYADPVADLLDKWGVFRARLFREACVFIRGNYVKDLGQLGREIDCVAIIDNSPASYMLHPENAIPITSWFDDPNDSQLLEILPALERLAAHLQPDVRTSGARDLLRELIGPVPHVAALSSPITTSGHPSNSVVTSAVNPNTIHQDSGVVASVNTTPASSKASQPSSPFSPQPNLGANSSASGVSSSLQTSTPNKSQSRSRFNAH